MIKRNKIIAMKKVFLLLILMAFATCKKNTPSLVPYATTSGNIYTIAGTGASGYNGDNIAAVSALLNNPQGIAADINGNVYIADNWSCRVRKISQTGIISTVAGNGTSGFAGDGGAAISAQLQQPQSVAVDNSGNLYIVTNGDSRIRKVNTSGIITTIAGVGTYGYSGDGGPATAAAISWCTGIAVDVSGNIYIADGGNQRIRKISAAGIITTIAGSGVQGEPYTYQATNARLNNPQGVAVDTSGNVYVTDGNQCIWKVTASGVISNITHNGTASYGNDGDGGPAYKASVNYPSGIVSDGSGNIYFSDLGNDRIREINTSGIINTVAGNGIFSGTYPNFTGGFSGDGGPATSARLNYPAYLAVDKVGNLYITDVQNLRIRKVNK